MSRAARLGEPAHASLLESMQTAARGQAGLGGPLGEIVAEPVFRAGFAVGRDDVGQVYLGHGIARRLQLRRHRHINVFAAVGALYANTPIPNVLRTNPDDLAAPRCGLEREFHDQPLLRPERQWARYCAISSSVQV